MHWFLISIYYFLVDPFVVTNQGLSAVLSCELSRLLENLELRCAFNTLAAVTPDRLDGTHYPKLRNAFSVNRRKLSDEPYVGVQILKESTNRTWQLNFV